MKKSTFLGFQIVGASNMVRFCSTVLKARPTKNASLNNGCATIDLCVSGQRIRGLQERLKINKEKMSQNIIICIGTNDVLRMKPVKGFKVGLRTIMKILRGHNIVWLKIPPIPKLAGSKPHNRRIKQFNDAIWKLAKFKNTKVLDLFAFCHSEGNIRQELFSKYYTRPRYLSYLSPKIDGIHFKPTGLNKVAMWLKNANQ